MKSFALRPDTVTHSALQCYSFRYTNNGPAPNTTDTSTCGKASETGTYFHPTEMHGITIQEGPDGNTDLQPTYVT